MSSIATTSKASSGNTECQRPQSTFHDKGRYQNSDYTLSANKTQGHPLQSCTSTREARMLFQKSGTDLGRPHPQTTHTPRRGFFSWKSAFYTAIFIFAIMQIGDCMKRPEYTQQSQTNRSGRKPYGGARQRRDMNANHANRKGKDKEHKTEKYISSQGYILTVENLVNQDKIKNKMKEWARNIRIFFNNGTVDPEYKTQAMKHNDFTVSDDVIKSTGEAAKKRYQKEYNFIALNGEIRNKLKDINYNANLVPMDHILEQYDHETPGEYQRRKRYHVDIRRYAQFLLELLPRDEPFSTKTHENRINRARLLQCILGEFILVKGERSRSGCGHRLKYRELVKEEATGAKKAPAPPTDDETAPGPHRARSASKAGAEKKTGRRSKKSRRDSESASAAHSCSGQPEPLKKKQEKKRKTPPAEQKEEDENKPFLSRTAIRAFKGIYHSSLHHCLVSENNSKIVKYNVSEVGYKQYETQRVDHGIKLVEFQDHQFPHIYGNLEERIMVRVDLTKRDRRPERIVIRMLPDSNYAKTWNLNEGESFSWGEFAKKALPNEQQKQKAFNPTMIFDGEGHPTKRVYGKKDFQVGCVTIECKSAGAPFTEFGETGWKPEADKIFEPESDESS